MEFQLYDVTLVPIIVALVRVARMMGVSARWLPAVSLALGIAAGIFYIAPNDPKQGVLAGVMMGLTAIGAWSGVKNTLENKYEERKIKR